MAELAVARAFGEAELGDEPRLGPGDVAGPGRVDERRLASGQRRQAPMEIGQDGLGEPGTDLAGVAQHGAVPGADQERAEMLTAAAGRREAADDELLLGPHLHLAPRR